MTQEAVSLKFYTNPSELLLKREVAREIDVSPCCF